jgi:ureidoacrylate peracid hydrolase
LQEILDTLEKKVDPAHSALLVVDVQNDFCAKDGAFDKAGLNLEMVRDMVPRLVEFIEAARKAGYFIVFIRNNYNSENNPFLSDVWLEQAGRTRRGLYTKIPMCVPGSWGADFYKIKPESGEPVVTKHRFDAFEGTDLDLILRAKRVRTLVFTGFATNVCVETTARHGFLKDYYIVVLEDLVASDSKKLHESALENLRTFFGEVVESSKIPGILRRQSDND